MEVNVGDLWVVNNSVVWLVVSTNPICGICRVNSTPSGITLLKEDARDRWRFLCRVQPGQIWRRRTDSKEFLITKVDSSGIFSHNFPVSLLGHIREYESWSLVGEKTIPKEPVKIRPNQYWSDGQYEYCLLDNEMRNGQTTLKYLMRREDGLKMSVRADTLAEKFQFKSGPTHPITFSEQLDNLLHVETPYPPAGMTSGEWQKFIWRQVSLAMEAQEKSPNRKLYIIPEVLEVLRGKRGNQGIWDVAHRWSCHV